VKKTKKKGENTVSISSPNKVTITHQKQQTHTHTPRTMKFQLAVVASLVGAASTAIVSAKTMIGTMKTGGSLRRRVVVASNANGAASSTQVAASSHQTTIRSLEEQQNQNDDAANAANDDQNGNNDDGQLQGYLKASQCRAFTTQPVDENEQLESLLDWAQLSNGNFVYVSQASYMFYTYNEVVNGQTTSTPYITDLPTWVGTLDGVANGNNNNGNNNNGNNLCVELENPPQELLNDEVLQAYLNLDYDQYQEDMNNQRDRRRRHLEQQNGNWQPKLYVGVMCDMLQRTHPTTMNVGIFLDDECSVWVPRFTYEYREIVSRSSEGDTSGLYSKLSDVSSSTTSSSTTTLDCPTIGVCGDILDASADTKQCAVYGGGGGQDNNNGRKLEEADEGEDQAEQGNYQLYRDDLDDISAACVNTQAALLNGQDLRSYLSDNKSLPKESGLSKGGKIALWIFGVLFFMLASLFCCYYIKKSQKSASDDDEDETELQKNGNGRRGRNRSSTNQNNRSSRRSRSRATSRSGSRDEPLMDDVDDYHEGGGGGSDRRSSSRRRGSSSRRSSSSPYNENASQGTRNNNKKRGGLGRFFSGFRRGGGGGGGRGQI
jgi:hypothetical protein